jgi:Fe-S cluster assembly scaffold protein SufB
MSTYSPNLRIELITAGDQAGTWGNTTNTNLGTLIEDAIAGYVAVSITSTNQALTALNGAADQSRNMTIALTTTTGAAFNVYAPPAEKTYVIYNASSYAATIYNSTAIGNTTAAGAGVVIPVGKTMTVWSNGTNFYFQNTHIVGNVTGSSGSLATTNFSIVESGGKLYFKYGATNIASMDSSGNITSLANITAYGTP